MSHDAFILALQPLPDRPGGWVHTPESPLWFAAVHLRTDAVVGHPVLQPHIDAQGGAAAVISLNYRWPAAEYAERYIEVLRRATGGSVVLEQTLRHPCVAARPMSVEAIERALLLADLEELRFDPELRAYPRRDDDDAYSYEPPRVEAEEAPGDPVWTVLCPVDPGPLGLPESPWIRSRVDDFVAWGRRNTLRAAQIIGDRRLAAEYTAAVEVRVNEASLTRSEYRAFHEALQALTERTGGLPLDRWD